MSRPFFSNYADQFLKLIDVDGSCDSPACRKQLVVYRPFRVPPNEEEMFALVALRHVGAKWRVVHRCRKGSSSHLQSLDFSEIPFGADGRGETDRC